MARRDFKPASQTPAAKGRKSGRGTLIILVVGMALGSGLTLTLTQWLSSPPDTEKPITTAKDSSSKAPATKHRSPPKPTPTPVESLSPSPKAPAARVLPTPSPTPTPTAARPSAPATVAPVVSVPTGKPASKTSRIEDADFDTKKTPVIKPAPKPREIFWLQVAALRKEEDARRLRARLLLLNLDVVIAPSEDGVYYRVRVGPYKTEALALEREDLLSRNNLTPRLIKEPVFP